MTLEKNEELNLLVHKFANLLSASMKDEAVRKFIKQEAVAQFDGDYDILFAAAKGKTIEGMTNARGERMTFQETLYAQAGAARVDESKLDQLMTQLEAEYPTMQIAMPDLAIGSAEDWKTDSLNPLVAVTDVDFDESNTEVITAYDSEGNSFEISTNEEPDELIIVVSPSERVLAFSIDSDVAASCFLNKPVAQTVNHKIYLTDEVLIECGGTGNNSSEIGNRSNASCDDENIHRLFFQEKGF